MFDARARIPRTDLTRKSVWHVMRKLQLETRAAVAETTRAISGSTDARIPARRPSVVTTLIFENMGGSYDLAAHFNRDVADF